MRIRNNPAAFACFVIFCSRNKCQRLITVVISPHAVPAPCLISNHIFYQFHTPLPNSCISFAEMISPSFGFLLFAHHSCAIFNISTPQHAGVVLWWCKHTQLVLLLLLLLLQQQHQTPFSPSSVSSSHPPAFSPRCLSLPSKRKEVSLSGRDTPWSKSQGCQGGTDGGGDGEDGDGDAEGVRSEVAARWQLWVMAAITVSLHPRSPF